MAIDKNKKLSSIFMVFYLFYYFFINVSNSLGSLKYILINWFISKFLLLEPISFLIALYKASVAINVLTLAYSDEILNS